MCLSGIAEGGASGTSAGCPLTPPGTISRTLGDTKLVETLIFFKEYDPGRRLWFVSYSINKATYVTHVRTELPLAGRAQKREQLILGQCIMSIFRIRKKDLPVC